MNKWPKFLLIASGLLVGTAEAAVCTSMGAGDWTATTLWNCSDLPLPRILLPTDSVVIAHNAVRMRINFTVAGITINAGAVLNDNGRNLTVNGNVVINGQLGTNKGGALSMGTAGATLSGTGIVKNIVIEIDAANITLAAGSSLDFDPNAEIDVGANQPGSLTLNGTVTAATQAAGDRVIRVSSGGALTIGTSGVVNAPNSRLDVRDGASATNNGAITIGELRGRVGIPVPVFTQGVNSTLNVSGAICVAACTFNASAAGNTVNYSGAAQTVYLPSGSAYANLTLSGSGAKTLPTGLTVAEDFIMSGTTTVAAPAALTVGGDFMIGAGNTFTPGAGTVTLNGASIQTIGAGTTDLSLFNLTVTNTAGITLARNVVVTGTLTGTVNLTLTCPLDFTLTSNGGATVQHSCPPPDHILISHTGSALTCSPQIVTIIACANAACTAPHYSGGVNVTLTPGGQTFAIDATGINSAATVQQSTTGNATLGATPYSYTCWNSTTGTADCAMTFSDSGFVVTVPNHTSCSNATAAIEAVQTAPGTGRCIPAYQNVTRAVNLYSSYANPASGTQVITASTGTVSTTAPGTTHNLAFDANGTATITLSYPDVGQLTLTAGDTAPTGKAMTGSGTFVVAPASFAFSGISAAPLKAGLVFNATVTAMNACATPTATANFGNETPSAEGTTLTFTKCQPTGTNSSNGTFTGSVGAFANGVASATNLSWSEAGNGDLTATLSSGSYLGSGLAASGNTGTGGPICSGAGNVGRFIPDHFDTVVTGPMTCPSGLTCPAGGLVYSGQSFTANVYARNAAGGITQNYDGTANTSPNFAQTVTLTAWDALGSTTTQNPPAATPGSITGTSGTIASSAFSRGATVSPGTPGAPIYTFGTIPTSPTDVYIRVTDADGVTSLRAVPSSSVEGGVKVVNGRIKVSNAYGSELLPLTLTATAQYYTATGWANSVTDSVTNLVLAASYPVRTGSTAVTVTPPSGNLSGGKLIIRLGAPGTTGSATINPTAPSYLPVTPGTATFGVYKGNNSYIYRRESY
jgi:MSHA biogenesis protein MshQ